MKIWLAQEVNKKRHNDVNYEKMLQNKILNDVNTKHGVHCTHSSFNTSIEYSIPINNAIAI